jgi:DNA (cytosine-5)-methyltransferase 1
VLSSREDGPALSSLPFLEHLLALQPNVRHPRQQSMPILYQRPLPLVGNLDVAVLRPEMQNPTHVTPLIASLAAGLIREQLVVVGPRPVPDMDQAAQEREVHAKLRRLLEKRMKPKRRTVIEFQPAERLKRTSVFYRSVHLDGIKYSVCLYWACGILVYVSSRAARSGITSLCTKKATIYQFIHI